LSKGELGKAYRISVERGFQDWVPALNPWMARSDVEYEMFALALFLIGKLLFDPLPCSRPEMPAKIIPAAMDFPCPFQ
jgi:hypothetical protein